MSRATGMKQGWLWGTLLALLVALAALLLRPPLAPAAPREVQFVQHMLQHHAQALDLAAPMLKRSRQRTVRSLALDIQLSQREQIRQMEAMLDRWGQVPGPPLSPGHARMMGMASGAEVAGLSTLPVAEAERQFLRLMIRHHQGAVDMTLPLLDAARRPEVERLARQMEHVTRRRAILARSVEFAKDRYEAGYAPYLEQLDAQRNLYQTEIEAITLRQEQLLNQLNLFKALGGGWAADRTAL